MKKRIMHLVVDSGGFIKNAPIQEYAENVYTVDGAVKEIKDKATLQRLQVLPYELKVKAPTTENFRYVTEFSKKTGDYSSLSATDLQIIALTYELEKEFVGTDHLNTEPECQVTNRPPADGIRPLVGFYYPPDDDDVNENVKDEGFSEKSSVSEDSSRPPENSTEDETLEVKEDDTQRADQDEDQSEGLAVDDECTESRDESVNGRDEEDDGSWITPQNLAEVQKRMADLSVDSDSEITVACISTDFAVQNVLLQMGLCVVSIDGYLIKHLKVFVLRCFACYKVTPDSTKQFCPNCGNKTLKRVSVSVANDGRKNIHINFKRPIKIRGTKYSLPMPKGGKHAVNPHVCEDQPFPQNRPSKKALNKLDVFSPDYLASVSPFAVHDLYSRAAGVGVYGMKQKTQRQRNPNEWLKRTGNKKHRK